MVRIAHCKKQIIPSEQYMVSHRIERIAFYAIAVKIKEGASIAARKNQTAKKPS